MKQSMRAVCCFHVTAFCLLLSGCGSGGNLAKVRGKVTLNGLPLEGVVVQFQPTEGRHSPSAGITDSAGEYEIMHTFSTPGAVLGEHSVSIRTAGTFYQEEGCSDLKQERVPAKYNSRTELKCRVEAGRNTINFDL
jgi:hypothetical protein